MVLDLIPEGSRIVEIGVFEGEFAEVLLKTRPSKLFLIDPWDSVSVSGDANGNNVHPADLPQVFEKLKERFREHEAVRLLRGRSPPALAEVGKIGDGFVDAVYIDGDHSYEGVRRDLLASLRIVRPGGWIMGHDYDMNPEKTSNRYDFGVKRAVEEVCAAHDLKISALAMDGCISYAIRVPEKPEPLYSGWGC